MKYAGRYDKEFGVKAVKFSQSYYTNFERQEITVRGLLLTAVEIPTQRKIDVDFVLVESNVNQMDFRLRLIEKWLYDAGVNKLFCNEDETRYYKARCYSISAPTFKGTTCRFTAKFVCDDYRPYDSRTDEPIGAAKQISPNFTFAGKHCLNDMHCMFEIDEFDATPEVTRNAYEISGLSGTYLFDNDERVLSEKKMKGKLYFVGDGTSNDNLLTNEQRVERIHEVSSWLVNAKRSYFIFDSDSTRRYKAECVEASKYSFKDWQNGSIDVTFVLQPIAEDVTAKTKTSSLTLVANTDNVISLESNDGLGTIGYKTPVNVLITNNGSNEITDLRIRYRDENDGTKYLRIYGSDFSLASGQSITISSDDRTVYIGSSMALKYIKSGDFPIICPSATKEIGIRSNVATTVSVTLTYRVRWL